MWEYNAPQYVDFTKRNDDDKADAYFGTVATAYQNDIYTDVTKHRTARTALGVDVHGG